MKIPVFILSISLYFSSCSFTPRAEWVKEQEEKYKDIESIKTYLILI